MYVYVCIYIYIYTYIHLHIQTTHTILGGCIQCAGQEELLSKELDHAHEAAAYY